MIIVRTFTPVSAMVQGCGVSLHKNGRKAILCFVLYSFAVFSLMIIDIIIKMIYTLFC